MLGCGFRLGYGRRCLRVQARQPLIFNAVLLEHSQPRRIQVPHVLRRLQRRGPKSLLGQQKSLAPRLGLALAALAVEQQKLTVQNYFDAIVSHGIGRPVDHPHRADATFTQCVPVLARLAPVRRQHLDLVQRAQKARLDQAVQRPTHPGEEHGDLLVLRPAHISGQAAIRPRFPVVRLRAGAQIHDVGNHPPLGVQCRHRQWIRPLHQPGDPRRPGGIREKVARVAHPFALFFLHLHRHQRPGHWSVRHLTAPGERPRFDPQIPQPIFQRLLEPLPPSQQRRIGQRMSQQIGHQRRLSFHIIPRHALARVPRQIQRKTGVAYRGQRQRRESRLKRQLPIGGQAPRHIAVPIHSPNWADAIGHRLGAAQCLRVLGKATAKGHEKPLERVAIRVVPQHHPLAVAG